MATNKWSKERLQSTTRGHLSHYSKPKNEKTTQSSKACWVKHEPSARPAGIRFLAIAIANQSGLCLLPSTIGTAPRYTQTDTPHGIDKTLSKHSHIQPCHVCHDKTDISYTKST